VPVLGLDVRLKELLRHLERAGTVVAESSGLSHDTLNKMIRERGGTLASLRGVLDKFPDVDGHYLLTGRGSLLLSDRVPPSKTTVRDLP